MSGKKHTLKKVVSKFQILQNLLLLAAIVFVVITIQFADIVLIIFTSLHILIAFFHLDVMCTCFLQSFNFF